MLLRFVFSQILEGDRWKGVVHEMFLVEWTKKIELVTEQALKYLKQRTLLFEAFTMTDCSELLFCYGKMNFMKVFQKIILLFYKIDVLSEDVILNWYKQGHSAKVKILFLDQMKKIIERLQNAQDGEHDSQYIVESQSGEDDD